MFAETNAALIFAREPLMRRQDPTISTRPHRGVWMRAAQGLALAATGAVFLMLQACSSLEGAHPQYPIYMQDKPAEATQTPVQAGDDRPAVAPLAPTPIAPEGKVSTTDLAPPPPPPPPPPSTAAETPPAGEAPPVAPVKENRAGFIYVLQPHDTLYGVSRRFGVPVAQLYDLNGLPPTASLRVGQKILLPPSAVDKGVDPHASGSGMVKLAAALNKPAAAPPPPPARTETNKAETKADTNRSAVGKPSVAAPGKPANFDQPAPKPETKAPAAEAVAGFPSNEKLSEMGRGMFGWPLRGKILVPFGQLAPNVRNDGINIAAETGADVKAASDGVVVYEGNQVKELGNTIYIKHANGWYTGYSHLATMNVQNNQHVTRGQVIGTAGQTGVIDRPQLHFEIRYTPSTDIARPIDPMLVLPQ